MKSHSKNIISSNHRVDGKVCLITGPTSGIGQEVALELAKRGAKIILVGRNAKKCEFVKEQILNLGGVSPEIILCDMASQQQVKVAAKQFLAMNLPLHILVNNAGLLNRHRIVTEDGLEQTMAVNYFSAFQFTLLLLDKLKESSPARVINVTSSTYPLGKIDFENLNFEKNYGPIKSYACSKLAIVYFTRKLAELLKEHQVTVNVYNPKMIYTSLAVGNNQGSLVRFADFFWKRIAAPLEQGKTTPIYLATSPQVEKVTGKFFVDCQEIPLKKKALDDVVSNHLWEISKKITKI